MKARGKKRGQRLDIKNFLKNISVKDLIDISAKGTALFVTVIYIIGFIATNSYLSRFGYFDYQLTNLRFFVVGGLCAVYFACWYLFAGRHIIHGKSILVRQIENMRRTGSDRFWKFPLFIDSIFLESLSMICFSCVIFGSAVFPISLPELYMGPLALNYAVTYPLDVSNFDIKKPRTFFFIQLLTKIFMLLGFAALSYANPSLIKLFGAYFIMSAYLNAAIDAFERRVITKDLILFTAIFTVVITLSSIVWFGFSLYGDIRQQVGGGEKRPAMVDLREQTPDRLEKHLEGKIIYRNEKETVMLKTMESSPLVINNQDIARIQFIEPGEPSTLNKMIEAFKKLGILPQSFSLQNNGN